ncbi:MAG TPA: nucleotidyltransferase domain-containing protein [Roseiflexaceae bacterium]|nr:nucleotidyltransferase domain-containing protein [Roseiflexaceae bacterium]
MYGHHERVIRRMTERFQDDPAVLALIIIGSVARGDARADSDVDCHLVVTDDAYEARRAAHQLSVNADDLCDYPHGHAGGRVVNLGYLQDAAARGPEPVRFAFVHATPAFARVPDLDQLLAAIPRYPEHERTEKMISFASQLPVHLSYLVLGEYSQNPYLLAQTAVELVLFGGRLILAHNRMLYPNRKWFMQEFERAPEKPHDIIPIARQLLQQPDIAVATTFCERILQFQPWPQPPEGAMERFQNDREMQWQHGGVPLADS